jgi:hypothetical protein
MFFKIYLYCSTLDVYPCVMERRCSDGNIQNSSAKINAVRFIEKIKQG